MTITITDPNDSSHPTTLVYGQQRLVGSGNWGKGIGPNNLKMSLSPGVVLREYIGANRVQGEHVKCDHGSLTFDVERIFETPSDALSYVKGDFLAEKSEGSLKFDNAEVFAQAVVSNRAVAVVGCAVAVSYTIEG